jgi:hypothetical protein
MFFSRSAPRLAFGHRILFSSGSRICIPIDAMSRMSRGKKSLAYSPAL